MEAQVSLSGGWRELVGALELFAHLLQHGPAALMEEMARGYHFDPLQRGWLEASKACFT